MVDIPTREEREERQHEIARRLHHEGTHPVSVRDDTQLMVFINEDTGPLTVWSGAIDISPYTIDKVLPLPEGSHFNAYALLSPDWTREY